MNLQNVPSAEQKLAQSTFSTKPATGTTPTPGRILTDDTVFEEYPRPDGLKINRQSRRR
jgi:hypothetical protein